MPARLFTALALVGLGLGGGCGAPAPPPRVPVVLITAGALRADVVGPRSTGSWTPRLDEFAAAADWAGTAIVASSEPLVSAASLLCGASPWQHQALTAEHGLRSGFPTLAELLSHRGYATRAYVPSFLQEPLRAGFDEVADPLSGPAAARAVAELGDGDFLWLHFPDAEIAHGRWRRQAGQRPLARHRLMAFADPAEELPPTERDALWQAYERHVRALDRALSTVLDALRQGTAWDRALVILTATHGTEFGEHGQILYGENLGRTAIEVPLVVHLPGHAGALAAPRGGRVEQTRLWATVAEVTELEVPPVHPPSLFRESPAAVLSELYRRNGDNRFSLVDGDLQLHWATRFAPAEPGYYPALRILAGARDVDLGEPARRVFHRLDEAFRRTPPLSGPPGTAPELRLERWTARGVEPVADAAATNAMALELRRRWTRFADRERPPAEEGDLPDSAP